MLKNTLNMHENENQELKWKIEIKKSLSFSMRRND